MRILVVDDTEDSRELAEAALLSAGYADVSTAGSAVEAYELLGVENRTAIEEAIFDLVILDIVMPQIDGIEACARIRSNDCYSDVPIIMVTSLADIHSLANAFVAGANDYITKPLNRIELLARVRSALKLKAELDRRRAREQELLNFLSTWGDRRASVWIDEVTGLFVGEVAEAYLTAASRHQTDETVSLIALAIDRLDNYRSAQGDGVARDILAHVGTAVRRTLASIGAVGAAYRNGIIIVIAPEYDAVAAGKLGEALRAAVANLRIRNSEAIAAEHVTASVVVASGRVRRGVERAQLLTRAISTIKGAVTSGGNRVLALDVSIR